MWNVERRLFDVVHSVVVRIIDTGQIDTLSITPDNLALVDQHSDSDLLKTRNHTNRVMIA